MFILEITDLSSQINNQSILQKINLQIKPGEIHAIMGPNGSGKSTLANVLMGHPEHQITNGTINFNQQNINNLSPDKRANLGLFLVFQTPRAIAGVATSKYLHTIYKNNICIKENIDPKTANQNKEIRKKIALNKFRQIADEEIQQISIDKSLLNRSLNEGFSGGEKKKIEILQMKLLSPKLAILDELDSGLDIDSLRLCCEQIQLLNQTQQMSVLLITHFSRIFKYIKPDKVHLFTNGTIIKTGDINLAYEIEKAGYTEYCPQKCCLKVNKKC